MKKHSLLFTALLVIFFATPQLLLGVEQTWTDAKSGKKITAIIIDKKADHSSIQLQLASGKTTWLKTSRLSEEDQAFVKTWVKPPEYLKLKFERDQRGKVISVSVVAQADDSRCAFVATPEKKEGDGSSATFIFHGLDPKESREVELDLTRKWEIKITNEEQKVIGKINFDPTKKK